MIKCKFKKICPHFRVDSFTCRNGGRNYCGQFKIFEGKEKLIPFEKATEYQDLDAIHQNIVKCILSIELKEE